MSTDPERLQRLELERALQTLEAHLTNAAAESARSDSGAHSPTE